MSVRHGEEYAVDWEYWSVEVRIEQRLVQDVLVLQEHGSLIIICVVCHYSSDVLLSARLLSRLYMCNSHAASL
jgi:hypothetical protein